MASTSFSFSQPHLDRTFQLLIDPDNSHASEMAERAARSRRLLGNILNGSEASVVTAPVAENITSLMAAFRQGERSAADRLVHLFYPELRRLAAAKLRQERSDHSWHPTVLVNEFYLELVKIKALAPGNENQPERQAFFALAAHLMRRLLIRHARPLSQRVDQVQLPEHVISEKESLQSMQELEDMLSGLGKLNPDLRRVVEMKVFEGRAIEEMAAELGLSERTVARYWAFSKQWLDEHLS
jgi:RNA polymerase sigma factor (TIGR02999 family)